MTFVGNSLHDRILVDFALHTSALKRKADVVCEKADNRKWMT